MHLSLIWLKPFFGGDTFWGNKCSNLFQKYFFLCLLTPKMTCGCGGQRGVTGAFLSVWVEGLDVSRGPCVASLVSCWPLWQIFCSICSLTIMPPFLQSWETWWPLRCLAGLSWPLLHLPCILQFSTKFYLCLWIRLFISASDIGSSSSLLQYPMVGRLAFTSQLHPRSPVSIPHPIKAGVVLVVLITDLPFSAYPSPHLFCVVVSGEDILGAIFPVGHNIPYRNLNSWYILPKLPSVILPHFLSTHIC